MRDHLQYRDKNLSELKLFHPNKIFFAPRSDDDEIIGLRVYVDEERRKFLFCKNNNYISKNVDLFDFSDFHSFSYKISLEEGCGYLFTTIRAFSKACNLVVDRENEWCFGIEPANSNKPEECDEYKEMLLIIQDIENTFNAMRDETSNHYLSDALNTVSVRCPNCSALTITSGKIATCNYCGLSFVNPLYDVSQ